MTNPAIPEWSSLAAAVKVASLLAHLDECFGPASHPFDEGVVRQLVLDTRAGRRV